MPAEAKALSEKRSFDVVVVGGGVIGLSCGWRAAQRGTRVAVVERGEPGGGATRVAAGMLAPVGELTFGEPELLELTLAAARLYPEFVAELEAASGETTGYEQLGALHVALDRDGAAQLRRGPRPHRAPRRRAGGAAAPPPPEGRAGAGGPRPP